jgi:predicted metal-dependent phosphoesterase TrpH
MPALIDLHSHSIISDGLLTPSELVAHAAAQGVRVLALTDHDDVAGLQEAEVAADRHGIQLIHGVEISVTWRKRTLHIVGLKVDPTHAPLLAGLQNIRDGRHVRAEGMAAGLHRIGIEGALEGAYQYAKQGIISRTHFARFLVPGYVEHQWASLEDAMSWILGSGGHAVIAHPGRYDLGRTNMLLLMEEFRALGGLGIEVVTGSHSVDQYAEFARISRMFGLRASLGSDYHGPGHTYVEMGRLPELPEGCEPVWHDWPEASLLN